MPNKIRFGQQLPVTIESQRMLTRSAGLIPAHTQTLAKGPGQYSKGVCPAYLVKGKGALVWDIDGNQYLDYSMGVGPISLGYCYPAVDEAIRNQLENGITFSLMHPLEVEVAELIRDIVPHTESVRFSKTGADVTSAAVRLARAYTGRSNVFCCGYHGWHDWYISVTDRNTGIPVSTKDLTHTFSYNNIQSVIDGIDNDTAAIILEPMVVEEPRNNFLQDLRSICSDRGIILIFDEMWTGFRLALGGAQEYFGVRADLCTFSKAIANGMPLSVLTGRREIMNLLEEEVFFFTTFGGETLSLAAAKATIMELMKQRVPEDLAIKGKQLQSSINSIAQLRGMDYLRCVGEPCRTMIAISPSAGDPLEIKTFIQQELLRNGILWSGFHNLCYSHTLEDIEYTIQAYGEVLTVLDNAVRCGKVRSLLQGKVLEPVFRRTGNFNIKPKVAVAV